VYAEDDEEESRDRRLKRRYKLIQGIRFGSNLVYTTKRGFEKIKK
jgi:hypothetical protein